MKTQASEYTISHKNKQKHKPTMMFKMKIAILSVVVVVVHCNEYTTKISTSKRFIFFGRERTKMDDDGKGDVSRAASSMPFTGMEGIDHETNDAAENAAIGRRRGIDMNSEFRSDYKNVVQSSASHSFTGAEGMYPHQVSDPDTESPHAKKSKLTPFRNSSGKSKRDHIVKKDADMPRKDIKGKRILP